MNTWPIILFVFGMFFFSLGVVIIPYATNYGTKILSFVLILIGIGYTLGAVPHIVGDIKSKKKLLKKK